MSERHPFHDTNPKHLDCGELIDAETGMSLREATAGEASPGSGHGFFSCIMVNTILVLEPASSAGCKTTSGKGL